MRSSCTTMRVIVFIFKQLRLQMQINNGLRFISRFSYILIFCIQQSSVRSNNSVHLRSRLTKTMFQQLVLPLLLLVQFSHQARKQNGQFKVHLFITIQTFLQLILTVNLVIVIAVVMRIRNVSILFVVVMTENGDFGQVNMLLKSDLPLRKSTLGETCAICAREYSLTGKNTMMDCIMQNTREMWKVQLIDVINISMT